MEYEEDDVFEQEFLNERDVWNRVLGLDLGTGLIEFKFLMLCFKH